MCHTDKENTKMPDYPPTLPEDIGDTTDEQLSTWYKNIRDRHHRANRRQNLTSRKQKSSSHSHTTQEHVLARNPTKTSNTQKPKQTLILNHTTTQPKRGTITTTLTSPAIVAEPIQEHQKKHHLKPYPFIRRHPTTMTSSTNPSDTAMTPRDTTPKTSPTLLAIAKTISEKVNPSTTKQLNQSNNTTNSRTMPIRFQKTTTNLLKLPKTIPPAPTTTPTIPAAKHCIPLMIRLDHHMTTQAKFDKHRILEAILHAFQNIHPECNIQPTIPKHDPNQLEETSYKYKPIIMAADIPTNEDRNQYSKH
jgi:hypothetical protein